MYDRLMHARRQMPPLKALYAACSNKSSRQHRDRAVALALIHNFLPSCQCSFSRRPDQMLCGGTGTRLKHVRLLAHPDLAAHSCDAASGCEGTQGQEIIAHVGEAVPVVLAAIVVHQLAAQQGFEAPDGSTMPASVVVCEVGGLRGVGFGCFGGPVYPSYLQNGHHPPWRMTG